MPFCAPSSYSSLQYWPHICKQYIVWHNMYVLGSKWLYNTLVNHSLLSSPIYTISVIHPSTLPLQPRPPRQPTISFISLLYDAVDSIHICLSLLSTLYIPIGQTIRSPAQKTISTMSLSREINITTILTWWDVTDDTPPPSVDTDDDDDTATTPWYL